MRVTTRARSPNRLILQAIIKSFFCDKNIFNYKFQSLNAMAFVLRGKRFAKRVSLSREDENNKNERDSMVPRERVGG